MSTELTRRPQTSYSVMPTPARMNYATTLAGAADMIPRGLFDKQTGRPSPAKIFLVLEIGSTLGLEPSAALQGIDVIEGKAAISPQLMTGLIRGAGHKLRISEEGTIEGGDFKVTVTLIRHDDPDEPIAASWTPQQAARAGLCTYSLNVQTGTWEIKARSQKGDPLPWEQYTEDMCLWRALGRLGRRGANDVLMGIAYMPEELSMLVGEDGTRDTMIQDETEARLLAELLALDDKQDLRAFYTRVTNDQDWTPKLSAEFDAHLMRTTKDSGQRAVGAPGNTGDPDLDGEQEETLRHDEDGDLQGTEPANDLPREPVPVAAQAPASKPFDASAMSAPVEPEIDPEIADYERRVAAGEIPEA